MPAGGPSAHDSDVPGPIGAGLGRICRPLDVPRPRFTRDGAVGICGLTASCAGETAEAETMEISVNDSAPNRANRFLADLTEAMRVAAESAQVTSVDQCRIDSKAYVENLRARTQDDSEGLRKSAQDDVATIREQSKARVDRIRQETEQRISRRRELLDQELQEYNSAIELEVQRVQQRVAAFQSEVGQFFEQLLQGADPAVFASMASQMPDPPSFAEPDRETLASELRATRGQLYAPSAAAPAQEASAAMAANGNGRPSREVADHWWMDSPAALAGRVQAEPD